MCVNGLINEPTTGSTAATAMVGKKLRHFPFPQPNREFTQLYKLLRRGGVERCQKNKLVRSRGVERCQSYKLIRRGGVERCQSYKHLRRGGVERCQSYRLLRDVAWMFWLAI